jgi:ABC-type branched-subunit amino acid transport system substrate-binding protein
VRTRLCVLVGLFVVTLACDGGPGTGERRHASVAGPGVTATSIRLGVLTDESGPNKAFAVARLRAARVFFQALNDDGGINGRRVDLVVADHQFNRDVAVQKYLAMRESILMVEHVYPMAFVEDDLARDEVLASPVARYSRLAGKRLLVMTGPSYRDEMANAVDWLAGTLAEPEGTRIAAVSQADEYGADGLAGIEATARHHGFELAARVTYQPTDTDFSNQATALKDSGAKYVFMATQSRSTGRIVEACANIGFLPDFVGNYFSFKPQIIADNPALKPLFEKHWKTSGPYAHWGENVPGMKRMLEAIGRYAPDQSPEPLFVQGWVQAEIVAEILKRAEKMNDLTRPGIINALDSMRDVDLGGLSAPLSYGKDHLGRSPSRQTRIFETAVDDARYPDMLKPITPFSAAATDGPTDRVPNSQSR